MNLVELDMDIVPFGQPIPFVLRGLGGVLLAEKGFVIRSSKDLRRLIERGQTIYVDLDEAGDAYAAFLAQALEEDDANEALLAPVAPAPTAPQEGEPLREIEGVVNADWYAWQQLLTRLLRNPMEKGFMERFERLFRQFYTVVKRNPNEALLALMQMSAEEKRYYSATHSMLVSAICMMLARRVLQWPENRVQPLGRAGLTMKLSISHLQDVLSMQKEPLTPEQSEALRGHAQRSVQILQDLGVSDPLWLEAVRDHSLNVPGRLADRTLGNQMARMIQRADTFGARIAPRVSREPVSVTLAMEGCYYDETKAVDEVGAALVKTLGLYPPGAWVILANREIGVVIRGGDNAITPEVAVLLNPQGMPCEPILRDTSQPGFKIARPIPLKEARVHVALDKLLAL